MNYGKLAVPSVGWNENRFKPDARVIDRAKRDSDLRFWASIALMSAIALLVWVVLEPTVYYLLWRYLVMRL